MFLAQLRHVRAAEWSGETSVKNQEDMLFSSEVGEANLIAMEILQCEFRCGCI